jgi:uncharacterized membrane protein YesL
MRDSLSVVSAGLRDIWADVWTTLVCNLLWLLCVLLVIPGPPATLALFYYTNRLAHDEAADISDFWQAMRRYWGVAWRWGILNALMIALLAGDASLTERFVPTSAAHWLAGFYLAVLGSWILVQLYAVPFLFEQETPSVLTALRNGAVMVGKNLPFSLLFATLLAAALAIGALTFMLTFAVGGIFLASTCNHAVLNRLAALHSAQARPQNS